MSQEIPGSPLRAVPSAPPMAVPLELAAPELEVGQIWIAAPDHGEGVIVLITEVHDDGRIHRSLVRRIVLRGFGFDFQSRDLGRGTPIVSESDPRWAWKQDKLRQLRTVQARAADLGWQLYKLGEETGD
jgi:hypothetical protein